jgi:hypothetical protein
MYPIGAFRPTLLYWCKPWAPSSSGREVTDGPNSDFLGLRPLHVRHHAERAGGKKGESVPLSPHGMDQRKDFSPFMQQSTTSSTSNVISHRQEHTEPSEYRPCKRGGIVTFGACQA